MPPRDHADDVRAPLVLQIAHLRRRIAWLEARLEGRSTENEPLVAADDIADLLTADPDADSTIHAFLEGVRADARLEAVNELTAQQSEARTEYLAAERCLASVAGTLEEMRSAAERSGHAPAVRESLAWAARQLERAMIAAGPVVEELAAAERERVLAAGVEVLGLDGLEAADWVATVNSHVAVQAGPGRLNRDDDGTGPPARPGTDAGSGRGSGATADVERSHET